jgi:hypothetical protein
LLVYHTQRIDSAAAAASPETWKTQHDSGYEWVVLDDLDIEFRSGPIIDSAFRGNIFPSQAKPTTTVAMDYSLISDSFSP